MGLQDIKHLIGLNHFHEFWKGANEGTNGFNPVFAPWYRLPTRDDKWKEDTLKSLNYDYDKFRQEYDGEFLGSSGTLLNTSTLKLLKPATPLFSNDHSSQFEPPVKGRIYFTICDVSRGKGLDYSAFSVFDVTETPYRQVFTFRNNRITPTDYATIIYQISTMYNNAYTLIEINDLGEQVAYILQQDMGYEYMLFTERQVS